MIEWGSTRFWQAVNGSFSDVLCNPRSYRSDDRIPRFMNSQVARGNIYDLTNVSAKSAIEPTLHTVGIGKRLAIRPYQAFSDTINHLRNQLNLAYGTPNPRQRASAFKKVRGRSCVGTLKLKG